MKRAATVAVVVSLVLSAGASASTYGTVSATLLSASLGLNMGSMIQPYDSSWYTGPTGQINLQYMTTPPVLLNPQAFCIETQTVGIGSTYAYTVVDPWEVPVPLGPADQSQGPMGVAKANYLREFWALAFGSVTNNVTAAAFQLGAWEIVFEDLPTTPPTGWDVTTGKFSARLDAGDPTAAINQANAWLALVNGTGPKATLYGLKSDSAQDQIVSPEPATLVLMALGGVGLLARRRRGK